MPTERTDSSCQAGPVSQNQIRQCEHDIEFGSLLFEPSVLCFSETQLFLDDTEYVLYFRADRGLCVFCFLCGILAAFAQFLHLGWTTVDSVCRKWWSCYPTSTAGATVYPVFPPNCSGRASATRRSWSWPMCWAMTSYGRSGRILSQSHTARE